MKDSKALDREVATKIMGITCVRKMLEMKLTTGKHAIGYQLYWPDGGRVSQAMSIYGWGWHKSREDAWFHCYSFSTNIEHAWIVWQKLAESYQYFRAFVGMLGREDSGNDLVNSLMKLTPEKICTTALGVMKKARKGGRDDRNTG